MDTERAKANDSLGVNLSTTNGLAERVSARGNYWFSLYERQGGELLWRYRLYNIVTVVGKNLALDAYLGGSGYTVTGPYLGLISSTSYTGVSTNDTLTSHPGWLEAGGANAPTYGGGRPTVTWTPAAGGEKTSTATAFTFSGIGTVQGAFLVYGNGASNTVDSTGGTLYSAGAFASVQPVIAGNVLDVTYTASL